MENLSYILAFGPVVMIGRAPLSTAAHVVFGSFWGYALGEQIRTEERRSWQTLAGVIAAAIAHGFYNVTLFVFWPASILLVALGIAWTLGRFAWARRASPFRYRRNYPTIECPACHQSVIVISRFCRFCGEAIPSHAVQAGILTCSHCGDRLLR